MRRGRHRRRRLILNRDRNYERISEDDCDVWDELTVNAEYFSCPACQLVLDGSELVAAAGLGETFWIRDDEPDISLELEYCNECAHNLPTTTRTNTGSSARPCARAARTSSAGALRSQVVGAMVKTRRF